jgi:hypothetical protein
MLPAGKRIAKMKAPINTSLLVRVQARGGKFLADDIGGAEVTVRDSGTAEILGSGPVQGTSSGNLSLTYSLNASQNAVVTPGAPPVIQWLVPVAATSGLTLDLPLTRPTLLAVEARGPVGGLQSAQRVETSTWAFPGQAIDQGPGLVIELPGLVVQALSPGTHQAISSLPAQISFVAKVMMMCGCQIAPGEPWLPGDFAVSATIGEVGQPPSEVVPMPYQGSAPSIFAGAHTLRRQGFFQAVISATQHSTGNTGAATVTFYTALSS